MSPVLDALHDLALFKDVDQATLTQWSTSMTLKTIEKNAFLVKQGETGEVMYLLVRGSLRATVRTMTGRDIEISRLGPGDSVGEIQLIVGGVRSASVAAMEKSELLEVSRADFELIGAKLPKVMQRLRETARRRLHRSMLVGVLSEWIGPMDDKVVDELERIIEWVTVPSGQVLFKQGDPADCWYIAASGRLQAMVDDEGGPRVVGEVGRGESVGEMALITGQVRSATLFALRDSVLMKFPVAAFEEILWRFPGIGMAITRVLVKRVSLGQAAKRPLAEGLMIALVPVLSTTTPPAPLFMRAFETLGSVTQVSRQRLVEQRVIDSAALEDPSHPSWIRLSAWLEEERAHRSFVVLQADPSATAWTKWLVRQADHVVICADADANPDPTVLEGELFAAKGGAKRTLLLLHANGSKLPSGTMKWLAPRSIDQHLHAAVDRPADFERVARTVCGRTVSLALSGGGARGFAHLGVIQALQEAGVPIDAVGGTSAGASMAMLVAMQQSHAEMIATNKQIFSHKPFREVTVPVFALLGTGRVDRGLKQAFGELQLEDLWLPTVAISSNLTRCVPHVHTRGPVWKAVRASTSIPGVAVPVVENGELLVDGGLLNNLPVDVMRSRWGGTVIAVDAMGGDADMPGGVFPSPWAAAARRVLPFVGKDTSPSIVDILSRSMLLASQAHARAAREAADWVFHPPVNRYHLLDVDKIEEIANVGYAHAKEVLTEKPW